MAEKIGICSNPECRKPHSRSKTGPCSACYNKSYRKTPKGRAVTLDTNKRWVKANPAKRREHVERYRDKIGYYVPPEVLAIRAAVKQLEQALANPQNAQRVRQSSQRRLNASLERADRLKNRSLVLGDGQNHRTDVLGPSDEGTVRQEHP